MGQLVCLVMSKNPPRSAKQSVSYNEEEPESPPTRRPENEHKDYKRRDASPWGMPSAETIAQLKGKLKKRRSTDPPYVPNYYVRRKKGEPAAQRSASTEEEDSDIMQQYRRFWPNQGRAPKRRTPPSGPPPKLNLVRTTRQVWNKEGTGTVPMETTEFQIPPVLAARTVQHLDAARPSNKEVTQAKPDRILKAGPNPSPLRRWELLTEEEKTRSPRVVAVRTIMAAGQVYLILVKLAAVIAMLQLSQIEALAFFVCRNMRPIPATIIFYGQDQDFVRDLVQQLHWTVIHIDRIFACFTSKSSLISRAFRLPHPQWLHLAEICRYRQLFNYMPNHLRTHIVFSAIQQTLGLPTGDSDTEKALSYFSARLRMEWCLSISRKTDPTTPLRFVAYITKDAPDSALSLYVNSMLQTSEFLFNQACHSSQKIDGDSSRQWLLHPGLGALQAFNEARRYTVPFDSSGNFISIDFIAKELREKLEKGAPLDPDAFRMIVEPDGTVNTKVYRPAPPEQNPWRTSARAYPLPSEFTKPILRSIRVLKNNEEYSGLEPTVRDSDLPLILRGATRLFMPLEDFHAAYRKQTATADVVTRGEDRTWTPCARGPVFQPTNTSQTLCDQQRAEKLLSILQIPSPFDPVDPQEQPGPSQPRQPEDEEEFIQLFGEKEDAEFIRLIEQCDPYPVTQLPVCTESTETDPQYVTLQPVATAQPEQDLQQLPSCSYFLPPPPAAPQSLPSQSPDAKVADWIPQCDILPDQPQYEELTPENSPYALEPKQLDCHPYTQMSKTDIATYAQEFDPSKGWIGNDRSSIQLAFDIQNSLDDPEIQNQLLEVEREPPATE